MQPFNTIEELRRGVQDFVAHYKTPPGSSPGTVTAPWTKSAPSSKGLIDLAPPTYPWPPEQRSRLSQQPGALHIRSNPDFYTNGDHAMIWHERC